MVKKAEKGLLQLLVTGKDNMKQAGFTLIELMIVLVVLAVVLAVGIVAMTPSKSAVINQQVALVKGGLQQTCDQAAFGQRVFALIPSDKGLSMRYLRQQKWHDFEASKQVSWSEEFKVSWVVDEDVAKQNNLATPGWLCWPSGEVLEGSVTFELDDYFAKLSWDSFLRFEHKNE